MPRWTKDAMEMVKIKSWDEYLALPVNKWNIPEPPHDQVMENGNDDREGEDAGWSIADTFIYDLAFDKDGLDLIIVPGKCYCFGAIFCGDTAS